MLRRLCLVFSLLFLIYAGLLTTHAVAGFPQTRETGTRWPWLGDKPVGEDGFYMLTVADHMAREHRISYNYGQPATGFQPLTTFMWAAIDAVVTRAGGGDWAFVRFVLLFQCLLFLAFVWLLAGFAASIAPEAHRELVFFFSFVLCLFDFSLLRLFTYGLETGPYLTCLAVCLLLWKQLATTQKHRWRLAVLFGIAGGITGLARIDFGIVFALVLLFMLGKRYASPVQVLVSAGLAFLMVSPWFLYVHGVTGGWLPSSGKAEGQLITLHTLYRLPQALIALMAHIVPPSFAGANRTMQVPAAFCMLGLIGWMFIERRTLAAQCTAAFKQTLLPWALGFGGLIVVYPIFFWVVWFYPRYFAPVLVVWIPVLALFLAGQSLTRRFPVALALLLLAIFCVEDFRSLHTGRIASNHIISAGYVRKFYPTARVGAFQSGAFGFFDPNVVNLDGKMNDDVLRADKTDELDTYLDRSGVDVLIDWEPLMRHHLPASYMAAKWKPCPQPMPVPDSVCFVRVAP